MLRRGCWRRGAARSEETLQAPHSAAVGCCRRGGRWCALSRSCVSWWRPWWRWEACREARWSSRTRRAVAEGERRDLHGRSDRRAVSSGASAKEPQKRVYGGECAPLAHVVTFALSLAKNRRTRQVPAVDPALWAERLTLPPHGPPACDMGPGSFSVPLCALLWPHRYHHRHTQQVRGVWPALHATLVLAILQASQTRPADRVRARYASKSHLDLA
jgi:hypothetical protein